LLDHTRPPFEVDLTTPAVARIDDFLLGGGHNFMHDRATAKRLMAAVPDIKIAAIAHRGFVRRAVRTLAELGVRQFLDLGAGLPTLSAPHDVARQADPRAIVVYVDNDPVVVAHAELLTDMDPYTGVVAADLADPDYVLGDYVTRSLLDFTQPVAVLMCASLQHLPEEMDDDAAALVAAYVDALCPASYLVISHMTADYDARAAGAAREQYAKTSNPVRPRTVAWLGERFAGLDLLEPGVTTPALWRPDKPEAEEHPALFCVAVGRKPIA
jgi:hypothetical protein